MSKRTGIGRRWQAFVPSGWLARRARDVGFGERNRKLTPTRFFWIVVLGFGMKGAKTLRGLARFFTELTGIAVTDTAVQERFSETTVAFFEKAYQGLVQRAWGRVHVRLRQELARFKDINLVDSTVLRLGDRLAKIFGACRTNHTKAALKVHTVMSLKRAQVERMALTAERVHDRKGLEGAPWMNAKLLLFDLGYFCYPLFSSICAHGGSFVTRLKTRANGMVLDVGRGVLGPARSIGRKLNDCVFEGDVSDLDVAFGTGRDAVALRVIRIRGRMGTPDHWYVTDLSPEEFSPEEIAELYRLRWQIELLFKELKSEVALDEMPSQREEVVRVLVYATLIAIVLSRFICGEAAERAKLDPEILVPRLATRIVGEFASRLGEQLLTQGPRHLRKVLEDLLWTIAVHAREPNPGRPRAVRVQGRADR